MIWLLYWIEHVWRTTPSTTFGPQILLFRCGAGCCNMQNQVISIHPLISASHLPVIASFSLFLFFFSWESDQLWSYLVKNSDFGLVLLLRQQKLFMQYRFICTTNALIWVVFTHLCEFCKHICCYYHCDDLKVKSKVEWNFFLSFVLKRHWLNHLLIMQK